MRVVFDGTQTGFANNGGTQTIFHAADNLAKLGNQIFCLSKTQKFTWFKPKLAKLVNTRPKHFDVTIATGINSVKRVMALPGKKYWWIRGWETWAVSERVWLNSLGKFPNLLVNSKAYKRRIKETVGCDSTLVYSGVDFDDYYIEPQVRARSVRGVGILYNAGKDTKNAKLVVAVGEALSKLGYRVCLLGAKIPLELKYKFSLFTNPSVQIKRIMYNLCDVWVALSTSESLHIPPVEAALCGCAVVTTGAPFSGTRDYIKHNKTGIVVGDKHCSDVQEYVQAVEALMDNKKTRIQLATALRTRIESKLPSRLQVAEQLNEIIHP